MSLYALQLQPARFRKYAQLNDRRTERQRPLAPPDVLNIQRFEAEQHDCTALVGIANALAKVLFF